MRGQGRTYGVSGFYEVDERREVTGRLYFMDDIVDGNLVIEKKEIPVQGVFLDDDAHADIGFFANAPEGRLVFMLHTDNTPEDDQRTYEGMCGIVPEHTFRAKGTIDLNMRIAAALLATSLQHNFPPEDVTNARLTLT